MAFEKILKGILAGERAALARAITLTESRKPEMAAMGQSLVAHALEVGKERAAAGNAANRGGAPSFRIGLTGPPGAGKSTLLRMCAGLLRLESGTAEVMGHDLTVDRAAVRRSVGLLGHDTALYDDLTCLLYTSDAADEP